MIFVVRPQSLKSWLSWNREFGNNTYGTYKMVLCCCFICTRRICQEIHFKILLKLFLQIFSLMMNTHTAFYLFSGCLLRDCWLPTTILSKVRQLSNSWSLTLWSLYSTGEERDTNMQFMLTAVISVTVMQKVVETQWNRGEHLSAWEGSEGVPESVRKGTAVITELLAGPCIVTVPGPLGRRRSCALWVHHGEWQGWCGLGAFHVGA